MVLYYIRLTINRLKLKKNTRFKHFEVILPLIDIYNAQKKKDFPNLNDHQLHKVMEDSKFISQDDLENLLENLIISDRKRQILIEDY